MSDSYPYHLFEVFGVELEYAIVDATTLAVRPIADEVLKAVAGEIVSDIEGFGGITWSNELALHVLELKASAPLTSLSGAAERFHRNVQDVNAICARFNARLMPTAMHPWMDPRTELQLWPHDYHPVYETFNRIFDCRGHGWANLQSVHLNLPFGNDEEFARLHHAIRVLLPILPALSASSPIVEGQRSGFLDTRLEVYRNNAARIPSVAGLVIPEPVSSRREYEEKILKRIEREIAPHDPDQQLQGEWVNARGAIARFTRGAIEIRVLDVQECPRADLALCALIAATLQKILASPSFNIEKLRNYPTENLHTQLLESIRHADTAPIADNDYPRLLGLTGNYNTAIEIWRRLYDDLVSDGAILAEFPAPLSVILDAGTLARRIHQRLPDPFTKKDVFQLYRSLADCLQNNRMFA